MAIPAMDNLAAAAEFFVQVASGVPTERAAAISVGVDRQRINGLRHLVDQAEEALRWLDPLVGVDVETLLKDTPSRNAGPSRPKPKSDAAPPTAGEDPRDVHRLLDGLRSYRDLRHIALELAHRINPEQVPRAGSRGNSLLWVLNQFGRSDGLSTDDLAYAFCRMGIFSDDDADAPRKVSWELSELKRKGWPVERDGRLWRLNLPGRAR